MNEFLGCFENSGRKKRLENYVKKTVNSLRLRICEVKEMILGNEKIDQLDSFTYLIIIISKDGGCGKDVEVE